MVLTKNKDGLHDTEQAYKDRTATESRHKPAGACTEGKCGIGKDLLRILSHYLSLPFLTRVLMIANISLVTQNKRVYST